MTRYQAWHFYRRLAADGYRFESVNLPELVKGRVIYAVPRGHRQLALRAVLSTAFDQVRTVHRTGGSRV
jgi:hypothetical protein